MREQSENGKEEDVCVYKESDGRDANSSILLLGKQQRRVQRKKKKTKRIYDRWSRSRRHITRIPQRSTQMAAATVAAAAAAITGAKATNERSELLRLYFFTLLDSDFLRSSSRCSTFRRNACRTYFLPIENLWDMRRCALTALRPRGAIDKSSILFFLNSIDYLITEGKKQNPMLLIWWGWLGSYGARHRWK